MAFYRQTARSCVRILLCDEIDAAEQFRLFFGQKVTGVRATTANTRLPTIKSSTSVATLLQLQTVIIDEVIATVRILLDKCCLLDPSC